MYSWHSGTCAIIQVKLECRPANPAYPFVAGYAERWVADLCFGVKCISRYGHFNCIKKTVKRKLVS